MTPTSKRSRRFYRIPDEAVARFRQLLRETELTILECARRSGVAPPYQGSQISKRLKAVAAEERKQIGGGYWIDRQTQTIRPSVCTIRRAAELTGLDRKTVRRRIESGFVKTIRHPVSGIYVVRDVDIARLKALGSRSRAPKTARLNAFDVLEIRRLYQVGLSAADIVRTGLYDVSARQIRRVLDGSRWK